METCRLEMEGTIVFCPGGYVPQIVDSRLAMISLPRGQVVANLAASMDPIRRHQDPQPRLAQNPAS